MNIFRVVTLILVFIMSALSQAKTAVEENTIGLSLIQHGLPLPLSFHSDRTLQGNPIVELNDQGVFIDGKKVCTWRGGRFERREKSSFQLEGCPQGLPFLVRNHAVIMRSPEKSDSVVAVKYRDRTVYLKIGELKKSFYFQEAKSRKELSALQRAEQILKNPQFVQFKKELSACLEARSSDCLLKHFLTPKDEKSFSNLGADLGEEEFACIPGSNRDHFTANEISRCLFEESAKPLLKWFKHALSNGPKEMWVDHNDSLDPAEETITLRDPSSFNIRIQKVDDRYRVIKISM